MITVVGKTQDGKKIISGLGKLYFQEGLPLSVIFDGCQQKNLMPSWLHLYQELKENGMTRDRIMHLLSEHVFESYGKDFRDVILSRL